jgi:hypothetical protein
MPEMMRMRSWPLGQSTSYRFDFSLSDLGRSGGVPDGVTITVIASDEYDDKDKLVAKADVIARRRAEKLLRDALAELRRAPS